MNTLVSSTHLVRWAAERSAEGLLPFLVARLIRGTASGFTRFGFPSGDSVGRPGFDGVLEVATGNEYVPVGTSVWEMGRTDEVGSKAEEDYSKRTGEPGAVDPKQAAFVFVTPRRWTGKDKWLKSKRARSEWARVEAWDADDLEEWLRASPPVAAWLCREIHNLPEGFEDIQWVWENWASRTNPRLIPGLLLAGRNSVSERLQSWLAGPPSVLTVRAETADEALGVVAAFVESAPEPERSRLRSRVVAVSTTDAWRSLSGLRTPLVLLTRSPNGSALAANRGHHVLVAYSQDAAGSTFHITIDRLRSAEMETALRDMGLDWQRARDAANESKGQLSTLVGLLGSAASVSPPLWSTPEHGPRLVPLLLVGSWGTNESDIAAVAGVARTTRDDLDRLLTRWENEPDPPVRNVGGTWQWVSRRRGWDLLSHFLTRDDLRLFREAALTILGENDPSFELPADERWMASVRGRVSRFSDPLRQGVAEGLSLLAACGANLKAASDIGGYVDSAVRTVFGNRPDAARWYSLALVLPELAEASPDTFLSLVERDVLGDATVLSALIQQEGPMGGGGRRHHLLWALERLAWSPEYLTRVTTILGDLVSRDADGRGGNHPRETLRGILLPWRPQTAATAEQRLSAVDVLAECHSGIAFDLCLSLLPQDHDTTDSASRPKWRAWTTDSDRPNWEERIAVAHSHLDRLIRWSGDDPTRWAQLILRLPNFCPRRDTELLAELEARTFSEGVASGVDQLRTAIRRVVHRWRTALDMRLVPRLDDARLERIYHALEPSDPVRRHSWLFDQHVELLSARGNDWQAEDAARESAREAAVSELVAQSGPAGVTSLAVAVKDAWSVGYYAGRGELTDTQLTPLLEQWLDSEDRVLRDCARGAIWGRFQRAGWDWVGLLFPAEGDSWPVSRKVRFAYALPFGSPTWDWTATAGGEVESCYWAEVTSWGFADRARDAARAIRSLIQHGRPFAALTLAGRCLHSPRDSTAVPAELYLEVTRAATAAACGELTPTDGPDSEGTAQTLSDLLDEIERSGVATDQDLVRFEWAWLPALDHTLHGARTLQRVLSTDPSFFATVIRAAYRSTHEPPDKPDGHDEAASSRATHAGRLLVEWRVMPGMRQDRSVDEAVLSAWVAAARQACAESGHGGIGDHQIGQILARAPEGGDGHWPHEAVRRLIETHRNEDLEDGVVIGRLNSRGATMRPSNAGGEIERSREENYRSHATALSGTAPRTAALLRRLADLSRSDARWQDDRRDLNEFR